VTRQLHGTADVAKQQQVGQHEWPSGEEVMSLAATDDDDVRKCLACVEYCTTSRAVMLPRFSVKISFRLASGKASVLSNLFIQQFLEAFVRKTQLALT